MLGSSTQRCVNRAVQEFRQAGAAPRRTKSALCACYRRLCARMDKAKAKAVTAAACRLGRLCRRC